MTVIEKLKENKSTMKEKKKVGKRWKRYRIINTRTYILEWTGEMKKMHDCTKNKMFNEENEKEEETWFQSQVLVII